MVLTCTSQIFWLPTHCCSFLEIVMCLYFPGIAMLGWICLHSLAWSLKACLSLWQNSSSINLFTWRLFAATKKEVKYSNVISVQLLICNHLSCNKPKHWHISFLCTESPAMTFYFLLSLVGLLVHSFFLNLSHYVVLHTGSDMNIYIW